MKNYEITEEQIKDLAKGNAKVKKWYPEVFETKLEVGKWYFWKDGKKYILLFISKIQKNNIYGYGFLDGNFVENTIFYTEQHYKEACMCFDLSTDTEVLEALTNEAKKRGFVNKETYIRLENKTFQLEKNIGCFQFVSNGNILFYQGAPLFMNGIWATPIKTYTKEEAEKMLNAKII